MRQKGEAVLETVSVPGEAEQRVTPEAMACFGSKYVACKDLLIEAKCKERQLKQILAAQEVEPAFDPKTLGAILFRRADLSKSWEIRLANICTIQIAAFGRHLLELLIEDNSVESGKKPPRLVLCRNDPIQIDDLQGRCGQKRQFLSGPDREEKAKLLTAIVDLTNNPACIAIHRKGCQFG